MAFGYTYDEVGNLATYTENGTTQTYTYDDQGQLTSATDGTTTYTYTYDTVGNILTASDGTVNHSYSYTDDQWQDLLTAFDGHPIAYQGQTYDAETNTVTGTPTSGNPTSYYNGTRWTFGWANGRQLVTATDGDTDISYTYNADGLRMTKTVDGVKHTYLYAGGKLLRETYGDTTLDFFYGSNGTPFALKLDEETYYYITNLQGDVLFLVDAEGNTVAAYTYDPYGKPLTATGTLATTNPLRYRGYYYDTETGFYYLQSRYYDPTACRFINADIYISTGQGLLGNNMFAYCRSNPVSRKDTSGTEDVCVVDFNQDNNHANDLGNPSGGSGGGGNSDIKIYRYGYDGPEKLVPTQTDVNSRSGLSFSTHPRPGSAVTTIGEVNSTGVLRAELDTPRHVSVYPVNGTIGQWYDAGVCSIWTQALASVVIKN